MFNDSNHFYSYSLYEPRSIMVVLEKAQQAVTVIVSIGLPLVDTLLASLSSLHVGTSTPVQGPLHAPHQGTPISLDVALPHQDTSGHCLFRTIPFSRFPPPPPTPPAPLVHATPTSTSTIRHQINSSSALS